MNGKTPISLLQELMAARGISLPVYIEEGFGTSFKCTVKAGGVTACGYGTSKKNAKHESAKNALVKLRREDKSPEIKPRAENNNLFRNFVGELNEYAASRYGAKYPSYDFLTVSVDGEFFFKCSFANEESIGEGMNKKDAKQDSARKMLELVKKNQPVYERKVQEKTTITINNVEEIIEKYKQHSLSETSMVNSSKAGQVFEPTPGIILADEESIDSLRNKLKSHNICYTLTQFQINPCIMYVQINGTDLCFMAVGDDREEATRNVLRQVLQVKKTGCSLSTNHLLNFN
ncbi:hypothetical protein TcasGA2_TC032955 [Tribolium castaneum]|uniref:DRBM domain-containing protein n=2 Tax=Tribolium castaneum TaxID=7070 RepID=A0A139WIA7_TRICA|nr:PREDICTED: uncharacterized protein LOC103312757 [Tribolium castaneum]XP_015835139.1 PREDICTED: uncharacterized protein LOC103312757 [Tribolium castaneum]KYB27738.1 hypothetical protein TcasGA2_TC032955 [Tribolium castaneum]|eukprot:XP_008192424.1 PREDICTED: uncharacterized protein LOC103312757 [Tribolium castaneum]